MSDRLAVSYVLPLKADALDPDLDAHLRQMVDAVDDVVVVDGSDDDLFAAHDARWPARVHHLRPQQRTVMGKVGNVVTGLRAARHDIVVIADDDVRWTRDLLVAAVDRLGGADVVRPQNAFDPAPWHARWDTGRTLLNRLVGGDWPGTLVVRRGALPHGYAGDALFENLELVRTVRAGGGREVLALDIVVPRRPPTTRRFVEQRVRQAYDEWARPWRLVLQLMVLPAVVRWRWQAVVAIGAGAAVAAEAGRRRAGGRAVWPATAALWAPAWVAERAVTAWLAVGSRLRGGVRYRGGRLALAANPVRRIRRRMASVPPEPVGVDGRLGGVEGVLDVGEPDGRADDGRGRHDLERGTDPDRQPPAPEQAAEPGGVDERHAGEIEANQRGAVEAAVDGIDERVDAADVEVAGDDDRGGAVGVGRRRLQPATRADDFDGDTGDGEAGALPTDPLGGRR